jgi:hypothetical protein
MPAKRQAAKYDTFTSFIPDQIKKSLPGRNHALFETIDGRVGFDAAGASLGVSEHPCKEISCVQPQR